MKLSEISKIIPFDVKKDGDFQSLGSLDILRSNQLIFIDNEKYLQMVEGKTNISCIITSSDIANLLNDKYGIGISNNPMIIYYEIHNYLAQNTEFYGKKFPSIIADSAKIAPSAFINDFNVIIGENCTISPHSCIQQGSIFDENVRIGCGSIIGGDGYRFIKVGQQVMSIVHAGGVHLHKNVEIQQNSCIDRGLYGNMTEIMEYSKIDNLVHIAHNVIIGKRCFIVAASMIGGSTKIGDDVWIGPNASISDHITIGNNVFITMGAVVTRNVESDKRLSGNFAIDHEKFIHFIKTIR